MKKTTPKGISFDNGRKRWIVRPIIDGKPFYGGTFDKLEYAIEMLNSLSPLIESSKVIKLSKPTQRLIKAFEWFRTHGSHLLTDQAALEYIKQMTEL